MNVSYPENPCASTPNPTNSTSANGKTLCTSPGQPANRGPVCDIVNRLASDDIEQWCQMRRGQSAEEIQAEMDQHIEEAFALDLDAIDSQGKPSANGNGHHAVAVNGCGVGDGTGETTAGDERDGHADDRVDIEITADFHEMVDQTSSALAKHPAIYERAETLVKVVRKGKSDPDDAAGVKRRVGTPQILILNPDSARTAASRLARFWKYDARHKGLIQKPPPGDVIASVLKEGSYPGARSLTGIIEAPTIRSDGSPLDQPGFDPATGLLYLPGEEFPPIPEHPTRAEAQRAAMDLFYLVHDFPFRADSDRAAWLAMVLTLIARAAILGPVPAYIFSANVAGSGKSTLATLAGMIASGRPPAYDGYTHDDVEMEKRLGAVAIAGDSLLLLDNAPSGAAIGGAAMDRAILAKGPYRARVLGKSEMGPLVPWRTVVAVTGNNLGTKADSLRRFVASFLCSPMERPETRDPSQFQVTKDTGLSLEQYVVRERARLVVAALTVIRGYIAAGRPRPPANVKLTPMDFPEWDALIRQAIYFATGIDPAGSGEQLQADDDTLRERHEVVSAWWDLCVELDQERNIERDVMRDGVTAREAAEAMNRRTDANFKAIRDAFSKAKALRSPEIDSNKLGYILRKCRNAPTPCGTLVETGEARSGVKIWAVSNRP